MEFNAPENLNLLQSIIENRHLNIAWHFIKNIGIALSLIVGVLGGGALFVGGIVGLFVLADHHHPILAISIGVLAISILIGVVATLDEMGII